MLFISVEMGKHKLFMVLASFHKMDLQLHLFSLILYLIGVNSVANRTLSLPRMEFADESVVQKAEKLLSA